MTKKKKMIRAALALPFVIGVLMVLYSYTTETYSTDEYWVAQGYHHVYDRSNGEIVCMINDGTSCKIKGDKIIVKQCNKKVWTAGFVIACIGAIPFFTVVYIISDELKHPPKEKQEENNDILRM